MKRFLLPIMFCFASFAYAECLPPTKTEINIKQAPGVKDSQTVRFGAYNIQVNPTKEIIFSKDVMIFLYEKINDSRKYLAFQSVENPIEDGSYQTKDTFLTAFGIIKEKDNTSDVINAVRTGMGICNGKYIQYHVENMSQQIIRYDAEILDKNNAYLIILNKNYQLADMLVFANFSDNEIENVLATLKEKAK